MTIEDAEIVGEVAAPDGSGRSVGAYAPNSEMMVLFEKMAALATNPQIDAGKLDALLRVVDYGKQEQFNKDKIAALLEMPTITKYGQILNKAGQVQSRYALFEDMMRVVKPILSQHNLVISFNVGNAGQMITVQPILSHTNGFVEKGEFMQLPIDTTGSKNGTQGAGSAASYGKRHAMKAMLNIVEIAEDNDGSGARTPGALDPWMQPLLDDAQRAAAKGSAAYAEWFKSIRSQMHKGWLVDKGHHEDMKQSAKEHD